MPRKSKTTKTTKSTTGQPKKRGKKKKEEVVQVVAAETVVEEMVEEKAVEVKKPVVLSSPSMWASHQVHQHATGLLQSVYKFNESKLCELMTTVYGETNQDVIDANVVNVLGPKPVRIKKVKDPNRPKKPPTGYQLFCKEYNNKHDPENKPSSLIELSKLQSKMWRTLTTEDKAQYLEHALAKKELYKKAMEVYHQRKTVVKKVVV